MTSKSVLAGYEPGDDLVFVQRGPGGGGTVHVVDKDSSRPLPWLESELPLDDMGGLVLLTAISPTPTLCGLWIRKNLGGLEQGGHLTDVFLDELLCGRCHRLLGDQASRAFRHAQHPDDEDDDG